MQEKKMELYRAIVKMEQEGDADGTLQDRVDRIQLDLDGLVKTLNERCKKYGLCGKPTTLTELPFGWQPGIQEGAADWDEDWDKFEDEGFTFVKELTLDVSNVLAPPNRNHHQFRKKKLPQLRVQLLLHLKMMSSQKSLRVWMIRLLKMEQRMIKMKRSQQKVLRIVHLPAVLLEAHLENFQILTMEGQQSQMPHPVIRNLKVMIMGVLGLCFPVTRVSMNQHGGHLTLMMKLTRCGVSMQLVPPRIWIRRLIRITTFLALGNSASTLSGLGHHKEVAFPRRAALLLSMILFSAHQCLPSIQDIHHQGTRIVQILHSTPFPGLIRLEAPKMLDTSLNQKHLEDLILCAAVEISIRVMDFQHLMTSQTLLALRRHLGHH